MLVCSKLRVLDVNPDQCHSWRPYEHGHATFETEITQLQNQAWSTVLQAPITGISQTELFTAMVPGIFNPAGDPAEYASKL